MSATLLTPTELGLKMGLSQGLDVGPALIPEYAMQEDWYGTFNLEHDLPPLMAQSDLDAATFWTEFRALYLPSVIRTYLRSPADGQTLYRQSTFWRVMDRILYYMLGFHSFNTTGAFRRFVREHPDEALEFYEVMLKRWLVDAPEPPPWIPAKEPKIYAVLTVRHLIRALFVHLPRTTHLPCLLPPSRSLQAGIVPLQKIIYPLVELDHMRPVAQTLTEGILTLQEMLSPRFPAGYGRLLLDRGVEKEEWWRCEARRNVGVPEAGDPGPCERRREGEEMEACARCEIVRYCSKRHQKQDWKAHKHSRVAATW